MSGGAAPIGWARRLHRSLGLALVPWVLAGSVAAFVANHSTGLVRPCEDAAEAQDAEIVAERALGHLMVGASLAGEVVQRVEGTARWMDDDDLEPARSGVELPRWARVERLAGFELPAQVAPPERDARLAFQVDSGGARWQCALGLDGSLVVGPLDGAGGAVGDARLDEPAEVASVALVDLVAAAGLTWALSACVVLGRCSDRRRTDLLALLGGTGTLAVYALTL